MNECKTLADSRLQITATDHKLETIMSQPSHLQALCMHRLGSSSQDPVGIGATDLEGRPFILNQAPAVWFAVGPPLLGPCAIIGQSRHIATR